MEKISLVSLRLRPKRLPATASERRAWERAQQYSAMGVAPSLNQDRNYVPLLQRSGTRAVDGAAQAIVLPAVLREGAPSDVRSRPTQPTAPSESSSGLDLDLTGEQSRALRGLGVWTHSADHCEVPLRGKIVKAPDSDRMVVQLVVGNVKSEVPQMLSVTEVARRLKMTRGTVIRLFRKARLQSYRVGNQYRVSESDLNDYLSKHRVSGVGHGYA